MLDDAAAQPAEWSVGDDMSAIFGTSRGAQLDTPAKAVPLAPRSPERRSYRGLLVVAVLAAVGIVAGVLALGGLRHRPVPVVAAHPAAVKPRPSAPPTAMVAIAPSVPATPVVDIAPAPRRADVPHARRTSHARPVQSTARRDDCGARSWNCLRAQENAADRELRNAYLGAIDAGVSREDLIAFRANWEGVRRETAHHPRALIDRYGMMSRQLRALSSEAGAGRY